jgi:hypothetical protein
VAINTPAPGHPLPKPAPSIQCKTSQKQPNSDDGKTSILKLKKTTVFQGKKVTAILLNSEPEVDNATSTDYGSSSNDDDNLSAKDKWVSLCCIMWLSTNIIYYRNVSAATVSVAKTSAMLMLILCMRRESVIKVVKFWMGGGVSSASMYFIVLSQHMPIPLYRKNRNPPASAGFYKLSNSTSTLHAHFMHEGGEHYRYYCEMCKKNNIPAVPKSPDVKEGNSSSMQSNISSFMTSPAPVPVWHWEGLLSHLCEWINLDN